MEFSELINKRESVRDYDPSRPVERDTLLRILEAGRVAPSAANLQPGRFIVVESEPLLSKVKAAYARDWIKDARHILVVAGSLNACWKRSYDGYLSLETDLTIAMDHMILAAANEGVGTCWIAAFDPAALKEALGLQEHERVFAFTPLGYPHPGWVNERKTTRKDGSEVFQFR
jgi:nitroreductase